MVKGLFPNAAYLHHSGTYKTIRGDADLYVISDSVLHTLPQPQWLVLATLFAPRYITKVQKKKIWLTFYFKFVTGNKCTELWYILHLTTPSNTDLLKCFWSGEYVFAYLKNDHSTSTIRWFIERILDKSGFFSKSLLNLLLTSPISLPFKFFWETFKVSSMLSGSAYDKWLFCNCSMNSYTTEYFSQISAISD